MTLIAKEIKDNIKRILQLYPNRESAIIPALHLIQREYRYISNEQIEELAGVLDVPAPYIFSTASFYTMFCTRPVGRFHIQICRNISCSLMGSKRIVEHIFEKLNIKPGQTTTDGKFTLSEVECLGACGGAPAMMINDRYYENLSVEKVDGILEGLK